MIDSRTRTWRRALARAGVGVAMAGAALTGALAAPVELASAYVKADLTERGRRTDSSLPESGTLNRLVQISQGALDPPVSITMPIGNSRAFPHPRGETAKLTMHADAAGTFWAGASTSFIPADYGPQTVATAHEAVVNMTLRYGFQKFADDARLTIDIAGADFGGIDGNLHESFFFAGFDLDVILSRFGPNVTPQTTVLSHRAAVWSILQPAGAFKLGDNQGDLEDSVHFEPLCGYSPSVHCNAGERQVGGIGFLDALSRDIDLGDIEVGEAFAIRYELKVWAYAPGGESVSWSYFRDPLAGDGSPEAAGGASFTHSGLRAARVPVDDIVVGDPSTVPEPTTAALLLLAVAAAGASERRQRRTRRPC